MGGAGVEGLAQRAEAWVHRQVARHRDRPVLELGAGTLNHMRYERGVGPYDIVEPFVDLYRDRPGLAGIRTRYSTLADIPVDCRYRRIISIAVPEHMTDLPAELARACLLLEPGGLFQAAIPSEGGFLWGLAWRCTTGLAYRLRTGLDYGVLMRHEHVNRAPEIISLVRHFFADVRLRRFPSPLHNMIVYAYIEARRPRLDVCHQFLQDHARNEK